MRKLGNTQMENRRLTINMVSNIISYSSTIFISFLLTPYLINTVGTETYSFYPLANNIVNYMGIIITALNSMANRYITIEIVKKDYKEANKYFSSVFFANIIMAIILLIPIIILIVSLESIMNIPIDIIRSVKLLFSFTFASMLVNIVTSVFGVATLAKNRIDLRSLQEMLIAIFRVFLYLLLFSIFTPDIAYVGIVAFVLSIITFAIQYFYTKKLLPMVHISKKYFSKEYVKTLLSSGTWNSINQLGNLLLVSGILIIANIYYGPMIAGQYSIVQTVPNFINGMISMLTGVFIPTMTYNYAENNIKSLLENLKKSQKIIGFFSSSVIAVFISLSYDFFNLWVPNENAMFLQVISTLTIIPHFAIGFMWPLSNLNTIMNKIKIPALFMLVSGIINISINLFVIRVFDTPSFIVIPIIGLCIQIIWIVLFIPTYSSHILKVNKFTFYPVFIKSVISSLFIIFIIVSLKRLVVIDSWTSFFLFGGFCGIMALTVNGCAIFGIKNIRPMIRTTFLKKKA